MREFRYMLLAGLGCALLGSCLGGLIALLSPEFIRAVFDHRFINEPISFGIVIGMIVGLFLGVIMMGFGLFIEALQIPKKNHEQTVNPE